MRLNFGNILIRIGEVWAELQTKNWKASDIQILNNAEEWRATVWKKDSSV